VIQITKLIESHPTGIRQLGMGKKIGPSCAKALGLSQSKIV
jgi:hypothetical protein